MGAGLAEALLGGGAGAERHVHRGPAGEGDLLQVRAEAGGVGLEGLDVAAEAAREAVGRLGL